VRVPGRLRRGGDGDPVDREPMEARLPPEWRDALDRFRAAGGRVRWAPRASPLGSCALMLEGDGRSDVGWGDRPEGAVEMAFERRRETPWRRRELVRELPPGGDSSDWRWTWRVISNTGRPKEVTVVLPDSLYRAEEGLQDTPGGLAGRVSQGSLVIDAYLGFLEPPTLITLCLHRIPDIRGHRR
jgi:hypothetical protein